MFALTRKAWWVLKQESSAIILFIYFIRQKINFLTSCRKNLHVLLYTSKLTSPLHSPHLGLSKCCTGLSLNSQAFLLLHPQLPCKQQPDFVCAVLVLIELYFAQVSNTNRLFAGQWNGCHDIYTTWNAVLYRSWIHKLFTAPKTLEWFIIIYLGLPCADFLMGCECWASEGLKIKTLWQHNGWLHKVSHQSLRFKDLFRIWIIP